MLGEAFQEIGDAIFYPPMVREIRVKPGQFCLGWKPVE
jgi:hypothetical protein